MKALEYGRYDINGYRFQLMKLEVSHSLAATTNNGVVANGEDASGLAADYNGVLQKIVEYMFGGTKELKVVLFLNVIGLIQSTAPEWMILVWWKRSMNHVIQATTFCLHIKHSRCTT
jgi:hypothetical protein